MDKKELVMLDLFRIGSRVRLVDEYLLKLKYETAIAVCLSDGTIIDFDDITWHYRVKFDSGEELDVRRSNLIRVYTPEIAQEYCKMLNEDICKNSCWSACWYCPQGGMFDRRTDKEIEELKIPCWINLVDRKHRDLEDDKRVIKRGDKYE